MDAHWVMEAIEKIAEFGKVGQGVSRLAYTAEDAEAKKYIIQLMQQAGLSVQRDAIGNIIGRMEGTDPHAPAIVTGSHLDTVPEGGKFDGIVGVVGGLAAIMALKERAPLRHPVELIVFAAEESSRFGFATMGSKAMIGNVNKKNWKKAVDAKGILLTEALTEQGLDFQQIDAAVRDRQSIGSFVELHIEQGPVLERSRNKIGIVEVVAAPTRLKITVNGVAAHSGTTPMNDRNDALVSAAMIVLAVQEIALQQSSRGTVGTVCDLKVQPGVMNVVPAQAEMRVDIRCIDYESIIETLQDIKDAVSTIAEEQDTPVAIEVLTSEKPVQLSRDIGRLVEEACRKLGVPYQHMHSGAGHDAMNMARITQAGMIFIPCREGISHNAGEFASSENIMAGINVLTETLFQLATQSS